MTPRASVLPSPCADSRGEQPLPGELEDRWALVAPHRTALLAVARRRCLNEADAEDCVSEALLRAVAAPQLDPERVGAWLCTVVMRLAADSHRERERQRRATARNEALLALEPPVPQDRVCDVLEARWLMSRLADVKGREADVLRARTAGQSVAQAARALGISDKAAENAWTRLRKKGLAALSTATAVVTAVAVWGRRSAGVAVPAVLVAATLAVDVDRGADASTRPPVAAPAAPATSAPALPDPPRGQRTVTAPDRSATRSEPSRPDLDRDAGRVVPEAGETVLRTPRVRAVRGVDMGAARVRRADEQRSFEESARHCAEHLSVLLDLEDPCSAGDVDVQLQVDVQLERSAAGAGPS